MNNREFSDNFDVLLNSYDSKAPFGDEASKQEISLNEYEKSVFLTMAEEDILKSYFDKTLNPHNQGFDDTERRQIEYSSLVKVTDLKPLEEKKTTNSSSSTGTDITPTRRLLATTPVLRASSDDSYPDGVEPGSDGYINIVLAAFNVWYTINNDFIFDHGSFSKQRFVTYNKSAAKCICNMLYGAKKLAKQKGLDGPLYCVCYAKVPGAYAKKALVKLIDISSADRFYDEKSPDAIPLPFYFDAQICCYLTDVAGKEVNILCCDYNGDCQFYVGRVSYDEAYGDSGISHYFWQTSHQDVVEHGYYSIFAYEHYFDKSPSGNKSGTKYIVYQVYTGKGSVGPIEYRTDAKWLSLYWGRESWSNRTAITVDLDPKNGTNNTGKPREATVYVTWWYYNQDGTSVPVTQELYFYQGTTDTAPADLGFIVNPEDVNVGALYPYDEEFYQSHGYYKYGTEYAVTITVAEGCSYSCALDNPSDTWIHFFSKNDSLHISCDPNSTGTGREGRIAVTATDGPRSITKYVTVFQPGADTTPKPIIQANGGSYNIVLDSAQGSSYEFTVETLYSLEEYTIDSSETDSWLSISNNYGYNYKGTITIRAGSANDSEQSRFTTFKISATGISGTTEITINVEQVAGFKEAPHISATPNQIVLPSTYIVASQQNKKTIVIDLTSGAHWSYSIAASANNDFFSVMSVAGAGNKLIVCLRKSNTSSTIKSGSFIVFLADSAGNALDLSNPAYYTTVQVIQQANTSSGDNTGGEGTTSLPPTISISPTTIIAGVNGGTFVFDKFWYERGELQKPQYDWGEGNTNDWFTLAYERGRITGSLSSPSTYNQVGAVLYVSQNTSNTERVGTVKVTVMGPSGRTETQPITIRQDAAEITPSPVDPDPEHPVPVINCAGTLDVPASRYEGIMADAKVHVFLPIALENADDYEVSVVTAGNIISKINKYDDGISVWCNENGGNARTASIKITAKNGYHTTEKTVTVRQAGVGDTQPEVSYYLKLSRYSITVESTRPKDQRIDVDTNLPSLDADTRSGSAWVDFDFLDSRCELSFENISSDETSGRTEEIVFSYKDDVDIPSFEACCLITQLAKPAINISPDKYDASYSGGLLTIPFTTTGIAPSTLKIIDKTVGYATYTLTPSGVIVNISENTSMEKRSMQFTLTGTNELGEEASATATIIQSVAPTYSGDDKPSGGGDSGEGGDSGSSGSQTPEYEDQTYTISKFDDRSLVFRLPRRTVNRQEQDGTTDVLFILNEKLIVPSETKGKFATDYTIKPISYLEYDRIMSRAYNYPMKRQAWRLFQNQTTGFDIISEIILANAAASVEGIVYRLRYVRRPKPIILEDLPDGLQIDGYTKETICEINPILHQDILVRAVQLALASKGRQTNSTEKQ